MANLKTTFSDGTGDLSVVYTGENNDSPKVSADTNCGEDRSVQLTVQTTEGDTVIQKTVTINQVGVREQFIPADETEGIVCADGERFLTIKEEYSGENYPEDCGIQTMTVDMSNIDSDSIKESVEQLGGQITG